MLATTVPLVDPVSLRTLKPGAYAWGVRRVDGDVFAFDFFNDRGAPAMSTLARQKDAGTDAGEGSNFDLDILTHDGPDSLLPPGYVYVCISYKEWKYCFSFQWHEITWPW